MIKVLLHGYSGKMGQMVEQIIRNNEDMKIVAGVGQENHELRIEYPVYADIELCKEELDVIIDFSNASATDKLLKYASNNRIPLVLCTTGLDVGTISSLDNYSKNIPIFKSANMSLGINVVNSVLEQITSILYHANFNIEVVEKHHNQKVDAPSGTTLLLADTINNELDNSLKYMYDRSLLKTKREKNEIGIHAIRGGTIPGEHAVIFAGNDEIIEITHTALSRKIFAEGAIKAAKFIVQKNHGLYCMKDLLD